MSIERVQQLERELRTLATTGQYEAGAFASLLSRLNDAWATLSPDEQARCHAAGRKALALSERADAAPARTLACTMEQWLALGPQWVRDMPDLEYVEISDREPDERMDYANGGVNFRWYNDKFSDTNDPSDLPRDIHAFFDELAYGNMEAAMRALSDACLAWARAQREGGADQ